MKFLANLQLESPSSSWNDRALIAAVVVAMVLSLVGYMHA